MASFLQCFNHLALALVLWPKAPKAGCRPGGPGGGAPWEDKKTHHFSFKKMLKILYKFCRLPQTYPQTTTDLCRPKGIPAQTKITDKHKDRVDIHFDSDLEPVFKPEFEHNFWYYNWFLMWFKTQLVCHYFSILDF